MWDRVFWGKERLAKIREEMKIAALRTLVESLIDPVWFFQKNATIYFSRLKMLISSLLLLPRMYVDGLLSPLQRQ